MPEKIKIKWKELKIGEVYVEGMETGEPVKINGVECCVGDFLLKSKAGLSVARADTVELNDCLRMHAIDEDFRELEIEGE